MAWLNKEEILNVVLNAENTTYLTHNFHPFSAKFIPQIPNLMIKRLTKKDEIVVDPFCGSGTTLVESKLLGRRSVGVDIHPLGVFMSEVKTTKIPPDELSVAPTILTIIEKRIDSATKLHREKTLLDFVTNPSESESFHYVVPKFPNGDHWFQEHVLHELSILYTSVMEADVSLKLRNLLLLAFSCIIVPVSNQDSETRYAAIKKRIQPKQPFTLFKHKAMDMVERMRTFFQVASDCEANAYHADARELDFLEDNSADVIITSPPYPNTYDYYLYHKLRMFWLKMDWERAKHNEIGSRLRHSSQRENVDTYMRDMAKCFEHFSRILKPRRPFVIVVGDSIIRKELLRGDEVVSELAKRTGFGLVEKAEYNLSYASKTFNPAFRNRAKLEHIILLRNQK